MSPPLNVERKHIVNRRATITAAAATAGLLVATAVNPVANAATPVDTAALRDAVTVEGVRAHQQAFQDIADDNGGIRTSGTPGYDESGEYVADLMEAAGYDVTIQEFQFAFFEETGLAELQQLAPNAVD